MFLIALFLSFLYIAAFDAFQDYMPAEVLAFPETVVAIDPTNSTAEPGQHFTINVAVVDVTDLNNWGARIKWPTGLLTTDEANVTEGPFLKQGGSTSFTKKVSASYVDLGCSLLGVLDVSGSGTLATITFNVLESGNCTIELDPTRTKLFDPSFATINRTLQDGYFYTNSPVALFTYSPYYDIDHPEGYGRPLVGETVTFNATTSYDPDGGDIVSYRWDFGDGTTRLYTGANLTTITTHIYPEARPDPRPGGNIEPYRVELQVIDDEGKTDSSEPRVTGASPLPYSVLRVRYHDIAVTNVTVTPIIFLSGATITVNVTVLNKGSVNEALNLTIYRNFEPVETVQFTYTTPETGLSVKTLKPDENKTVAIEWDTTGTYPGNYTLGVHAAVINPDTKESAPGVEKDEVLLDNWRLFGTITATGEEVHDVAVTSLKVSPNRLKIDEFSNIRVTIGNEGNRDEHYNATLNIRYGTEAFKQKKWSNQSIGPGATATLEFKFWLQGSNTTKEGDYEIAVNLIPVDAQTLDFLDPYNATVPDDDPADNKLNASASILMLPVAEFTYSPSQPLVDLPLTFDASTSYTLGIPIGNISKYSWDFGDGTSIEKTSPIAGHVFRLSGTYTVNLTVTDDSQQKSSMDAKITVLSDMAHILMNITFSPSVARPGESISVNVTVRNVGHLEETFNVTAYYDENELGEETDVTLDSGGNATFTFSWDTTGVPVGYYTIKTTASKLDAGEPTENTHIGGTIALGVGGMVPTSNITISASPPFLHVGQSTAISGYANPASAGARVMIYFRLRETKTWSNLSMVITDQDGRYEYTWTPQKIGLYALKSTLLGEGATLLGESGVEVAEVSGPLDIAFYATILLVAGLAALMHGGITILTFYFLKIRKSK